MVIFHFSFDLNNFHILSLDLKHDPFWHYFRYVIVSMFVFSAGMSLVLANKEGVDVRKFLKRVAVLGGASLLVSIGSYTQFPNTWIYFGILHFFLFATIFGLLFLRTPKIALLVGLFILLGYNLDFLHMHWLYKILQPILHLPVKYTEDLANIVPWFGLFLIGMSFASFGLHQYLFNNSFFNKRDKFNSFFAFLGRHSLLIYLLHQPILFGIFLLI